MAPPEFVATEPLPPALAPMKALSIRQPWAWLIIRPDLTDAEQRARELAKGRIKTIENRMWRTRERGTILVHASQGMTRAEYFGVMEFCYPLGVELPHFDDLQRGGIVGQVDIVDCVAHSESHWYMGAVGFVLANAKPLPFRPLKGALGFFEVAP
ncbi:ASCH domain-containing protein [Variovorax paradoxus]|uniref:ASCH domain-containing protein n=1 Tax=Variovorax paradoxus TaxID=34073 RepID=A0A679J8V7_VARPD|nr:hypothetical protein VVAX_03596 [Variovorax paradoxus]